MNDMFGIDDHGRRVYSAPLGLASEGDGRLTQGVALRYPISPLWGLGDEPK